MKTTLVVSDYVNCKFVNLDPITRKKFNEALKFMVPHARHTPQFKLKRWDGKVSFGSIGGSTYINLLHLVLPLIEEKGYEIDIDDRRKGLDFDFPVIDDEYIADRVWPEGHVKAGDPIVLRDYQVGAVNSFFENPQSIQQISTGAGKCCHFDTEIEVEIDPRNHFRSWIINYTEQVSIYLIRPRTSPITLKIGDLIEGIAKYKNEVLYINQEIGVADLGMRISTYLPNEMASIDNVIKKTDVLIELEFENGHILKCAQNHILVSHSREVFTKELKIGDVVDTKTSNLVIKNIIVGAEHELYDIGIAHPHLYVDAAGIIHHNTIITACLSLSVEKYGRSIVIVPSKDLVKQTEEDYRNIGLDVGVFFGDRKEWGHQHTICTWQSLSVFSKNSKAGDAPIPITDFLEDVVCVIIDECHGTKGAELKDLLCGPMANIPLRWGLTGTIPKEEYEFMSLLASIGPVVGEIKASDLQEIGVLSNCDIEVLQLQENHVEFNDWDDEQKFLTTDHDRLAWVGNYCIDLSKHGNTLILVERRETGFILEKLIPDSVFVYGDTKSDARSKEYKAIQTSDNKVIIATYGVASTGINIPRLFNLVLFSCGKSFVRTIQSVGRLLRTANDKNFANIKDLTSSLKFSKRHLSKRKEYYSEAGYPFHVRKIKYK